MKWLREADNFCNSFQAELINRNDTAGNYCHLPLFGVGHLSELTITISKGVPQGPPLDGRKEKENEAECGRRYTVELQQALEERH